MAELKKVITALDAALVQMHGCGRYTPEDVDELEKAAWDALKLLKAQEPVPPESENWWDHTHGRCGNCRAPLPAVEGLKSKFCWMCGRKVKWDG